MNRLHATKDFWLAALRADGPALRDAVAEAGPAAVVPPCPGWTTADLVEHLTSLLKGVRDTVPRGVMAALTSRLKIMSGVDITEKRVPSNRTRAVSVPSQRKPSASWAMARTSLEGRPSFGPHVVML